MEMIDQFLRVPLNKDNAIKNYTLHIKSIMSINNLKT